MTRSIRHRLALHSARALVLLGLISGVLCGCDYFRPARPEIPTGTGIVPRYSAPETTLVTLGLAIQDKSATNGQVAYAGCFADTSVDGIAYHAFFDPITLDRFPGQSSEWDNAREQIFYANLSRLQSGSQFTFLWGDFPGAPDDEISPTSAILHRSYRIYASPNVSTSVPVARGFADLYMTSSSGNWKIYRWQDFEDPQADLDIGEASFGQLRMSGPE